MMKLITILSFIIIVPLVYGNNGTCIWSYEEFIDNSQHGYGFSLSEYDQCHSKIQNICAEPRIDITLGLFIACIVVKYIMRTDWNQMGQIIMFFIGILYAGLSLLGIFLFSTYLKLGQHMSSYGRLPLKYYQIDILANATYSCGYPACGFEHGYSGIYVIINMIFLLYIAFMGILFCVRVSWSNLGKISMFLMGLVIIRQGLGVLYSVPNMCLMITIWFKWPNDQ